MNMHLTNRGFFLGFKVLFVLLCSWGLYLNSGIPSTGSVRWGVLNYYTILSNLICLVYFVASLVANLSQWRSRGRVFTYAPRAKGAVVFCITVTFLIYHFVLAPLQFQMGRADMVHSAANLLVHYVVPVMVILDWVLFDPKGAFRGYDPLWWIGIPYAYFLYILIRSRFAGNIEGTMSPFPYQFIDFAQLGWRQVLYNIGELTLVFVPIGYIYYLIDHCLLRLSERIRG